MMGGGNKNTKRSASYQRKISDMLSNKSKTSPKTVSKDIDLSSTSVTNSSKEATSTASIDSIGEIDLPSVESGSSNLAPSDSTLNTASSSSLSSSDAFTSDKEGLRENTGNIHIDYPYQPRKVIFPLRSFGNVRRVFKAEWFDYKNVLASL